MKQYGGTPVLKMTRAEDTYNTRAHVYLHTREIGISKLTSLIISNRVFEGNIQYYSSYENVFQSGAFITILLPVVEVAGN